MACAVHTPYPRQRDRFLFCFVFGYCGSLWGVGGVEELFIKAVLRNQAQASLLPQHPSSGITCVSYHVRPGHLS